MTYSTPTNACSAAGASTSHSGTRQEIVARAELKRIVDALEAFGPMRRRSLAEACGARHWDPGEFNSALRAGICEGVLRELSFGFVAAARVRPLGATAAAAPDAPATNDSADTPSSDTVDAGASPGRDDATDSESGTGVGSYRTAALQEGVREGIPVLIMLLAIAVPVGLLALSTLGDAVLLVGFAFAAMVLITIALVRTVNSVTAERTRGRGDVGCHSDRTHTPPPHAPRPLRRNRVRGRGAADHSSGARSERAVRGR